MKVQIHLGELPSRQSPPRSGRDHLENENYIEKRGQPDQLCLWLHLNRSIHALLGETAFKNALNEIAVCAQGFVLRIDTEIQSMDDHYDEWIDS